MKCSMTGKILTLWMVVMLLVPITGARAVAMDWEVAGSCSECGPQALAGLYFNFCPAEAGKLLRHAGCPKNGSIENAIVESTSCLREIIDDINMNSKFIDVLPGHPFANESKWLKTEKITSGSRFGGIFVPHV